VGVYRAALATIAQTGPLLQNKVQVSMIAHGGDRPRGNQVREMIERVAGKVNGDVISNCDHFSPEERPDEVVRYLTRAVCGNDRGPAGFACRRTIESVLDAVSARW
jgi:hypothetical protein